MSTTRIARKGGALSVVLVALGAVLTAPGVAAAAPPTISVTPTCGPATVTLQVSADGVPRNQDLFVIARRPNGDTVGYKSSFGDSAGRLSDTIAITAGRAPGAWVSVNTYGSPGAELARTWYHVQCAQFIATPTALVERSGPQDFGVTLTGFQPDTPVELSLPDQPPVSVTTDKAGNVSRTVTFPRQPACGRSVLTARQVTSDPDPPAPDIELTFSGGGAGAAALPSEPRVLTVGVVVFCPRLTVTPNSFTDSALPGTADVTGTGWVPLRPVELLLDGKPLATVTTDRATGSFTGPQKLPRLGCGAHRLEARQVNRELTLTQTAAVTVTCTPAFLAVNPAVTPAAMVTTAAGAGFTPGRMVKLEWQDLEGRPLGDAGNVQVGPGGTFLQACLVLPNSLLGTRRLRAVEVVAPGDPVSARTGAADLLVVPSAMERGRDQFLERG